MKRLGSMWHRVRRTRGLGRNMALILATAVGGVAAGGAYLSSQSFKMPWEKRVLYQADFAEAPSIAPGTAQEVRIAGVRVGDITKGEVIPTGRARLTLSIKREYAELYDNVRAFLRPKTPLNDMYVLLDPGGPPASPLRPGSIIPVTQTVPPVPADQVLAHLDERARGALRVLLTELDAALVRPQSLPGSLRGAANTVTKLRPIVEELAGRRERIARLVSGLADIAAAAGTDDDRLARLLTDTRSSLEALSARDAELDATLARLPGVADELHQVSRPLQALTGELNPVLDEVRAAADRLPGALAGVRGVVQRLDGTLDRLGPVVSAARPVVADLRPVVVSAGAALSDTAAWSPRLDPMTANLVSYLPWIQQAVYQANSVVSIDDANGPFARVRAPIFGENNLKPFPEMFQQPPPRQSKENRP